MENHVFPSHKTTKMKPSSIKQLSLSLLLLCALPLTNLRAHEGHDHEAPPAPEAGSAAEAWTNAQASFKAMQAAATSKDHDQIHNEQEKLAASLQHVMEKGVAGTDKARFDGAIKNAITASEKVHAAADAKDFAKVESGMKTLEATMAMVETQLGSAK
ncbi:hypothetical protein BH18VER1_BH18VER1_05200 [soil metagenome]